MTTARPGAAATHLAARATAVAGTFRDVANDLVARAQAQLAANEISVTDFNTVSQRCLSLQGQALAIDNEAFLEIAADAAQEFSAIEDATGELEKARHRITTAKEVIGVATKVLQAAGAVVTAILAPAAMPAAAVAIAVAVTGIAEVTGGGDDKP
jgi:hypothetical protein